MSNLRLGPLGLVDTVLLIQILADCIAHLRGSSLVLSHALLLLIHQVVCLPDVRSESVDLNILFLRENIAISVHGFVPGLGSSLRSLEIAFARHLRRLLDCIDAEDCEVRVLLQVFLVRGDVEVLGYHSHLTRAVQGCERYLRLERKFRHS